MSARVDPTRHYRLEGCLNDSERVGIGLYSFAASGAALLAGYAAFERQKRLPMAGSCSRLSPDAPGAGRLQLAPNRRVLIVRTLHRSAQGRPCRYDLLCWVSSKATGHWSLHAYNHWCEYLTGASVHDASAVANDGGRVRVCIGPSLAAGLPNRIDTLGRRRGVLIFRTLGASEQQLPLANLRR